ncbi:MAG: hypothetical protein R3C10_03515 [Pirellulales bacterium]
MIVLPKAAPKQKSTVTANAATNQVAGQKPLEQKPARRKAAVATGGLDDLLSGDLAALEQSAATVETTRKPPAKHQPVSTAYDPTAGRGSTALDRKTAERAAARTGMRMPGSTNFLLAIVAGVVAGACGAGVWAAIAYYADMQIGWIAWGIGAVVGIAMIAVGREGSLLLALCSLVIVFCSIIAGKAMAINMLISDMQADGSLPGVLEMTDENYISMLADDIAQNREDAGQQVIWPDVDYDEDYSVQDEYPADIWQQATAKWGDLGPDGQQNYREQFGVDTVEMSGAARGAIVGLGVVFTFGLFDIIFVGLAMVTSFKITLNGIGS